MASSSSSTFDFKGLEKKAIEEAFQVSIKVHNSGNPFEVKKLSGYVVIAFPGSWSVEDWYAGNNAFGETKVDLKLFRCLKSIGNYEEDRKDSDKERATVNKAFFERFRTIKDNPKASFCSHVVKAVKEKKKIIFAGHSSGGPIAIFATIWFFEEYIRLKEDAPPHPFCLTFGSPLTGDRIFCHAVHREKWSDHFINFVTRYDIVPRIMLAPLSSIEDELQEVLSYFNPAKQSYVPAETGDNIAKNFFTKVMESASCAASYAACTLTGGGMDDLLSTLLNFIDPSPYRPFGTYVFCSKKEMLAVKNPSAVLQLLFYSSQLSSEEECPEIASKSLVCHSEYKAELQRSMQNVRLFDMFQEIPIVLENGAGAGARAIDAVLKDLGLSEKGRMSLHAAMEYEKQKQENQLKFEKLIPTRAERKNNVEKDGDYIKEFEILEDYRKTCRETHKIGYYDSFKKSEHRDEDFQANVSRLKLAGVWDEIIELIKRYELPDTFEGDKDWIERGTDFRHLVEPLDIANFYRHNKYDDSGPYMGDRGRPRRYRYTQRWLEHSKLPNGLCGESCFWAYLEQDLVDAEKKGEVNVSVSLDKFEEMDKNLKKWYDDGLINEDVFFENSTLVKWWKRLPKSHREVSSFIKAKGQLNAS